MIEVTCEIFNCINNDGEGFCLQDKLRINVWKTCDNCYIPED